MAKMAVILSLIAWKGRTVFELIEYSFIFQNIIKAIFVETGYFDG